MCKVGTAPGQGGGPAQATGRLALLIRRAGNLLFEGADARAMQYGWQITPQRGGLARAYRDPRFDRFLRCPACGGTGLEPGKQSCLPCAGTGRIKITEWSLADRGRG
jgi:hypothetical protein